MVARPDSASVVAWPLGARGASLCSAAAVVALFVAAAIATAGGGVARIRGVSIGLKSPWPAFAAGATCAALAWWLSRRPRGRVGTGDDAPGAVAFPPRALEPRCMACIGAAVALACAAALVAWAYATESAAGADASGYLNAAKLFAQGATSVPVPLAADAPWPDALRTLAPLGFRPGAAPAASGTAAPSIVPTYAPGLPLVLAAAMRASANAWTLVVPLFAAIAVLATFVVGTTVATPRAGLLAACGLAASPVFLFHAIQPMSDVPTTAWWLLSLAAALRLTSVPGIAASGLCAGAAILTRPNLAPLALVVLAVVLVARHSAHAPSPSSGPRGQHDEAWRRRAVVTAAAFVAAAVPGVAAVAWFNARLYGSPIVSGYGATGDLFSLSFVPLNVARYAGWLFDVHPSGALASVVAVVFFVLSWRAAARGPDAPGARALFVTLAGFAVLNVGAYLVYAPFENWTYLRFLLPSFPLAAIASASVVDRAISRACAAVPPLATPLPQALVAAIACGLVAGAGVRESAARGVFERRAIESRHELMARAYAPGAASVVFVTQQHGGAALFHLGAPVVRWDLIDPAALDAALAWLVSRRLSPVFLVDADEEAAFRERFTGRGPWARLDWPPRYETMPPLRARAYELADRLRFDAGESWQPVVLGRARR